MKYVKKKKKMKLDWVHFTWVGRQLQTIFHFKPNPFYMCLYERNLIVKNHCSREVKKSTTEAFLVVLNEIL
jgi:hypothetical protein